MNKRNTTVAHSVQMFTHAPEIGFSSQLRFLAPSCDCR